MPAPSSLRFVPLTAHHIPEAIALVRNAAAQEREHVPSLPVDETTGTLSDSVARMSRDGHGVAALDSGRLAGVLSFHGPIGSFFGTSTGAFAPLHGAVVSNDADGGRRGRLYSMLFQYAAELLTPHGVDCFAITTFAHDRDAARAFSLGGFGIRCADAIRTLGTLIDAPATPGVSYQEIPWTEAATSLLPLKNGLVDHLHKGPTFVAASAFTEESFAELCAKRQSRFFIAHDGVAAIAYMELLDEGENYLTSNADMPNICGAFLIPEFRGRGIFQNLLNLVLQTLHQEGMTRIGVDFETINPTALHFWEKYFDIYTTSWVRRIDEIEETTQ